MSKFIKMIAAEVIKKHNLTHFDNGSLDIIHEIYDECVKQGLRCPCKLYNGAPHPLDIRDRIIKAMKTGYYFTYTHINKRFTIYTLKEKL